MGEPLDSDRAYSNRLAEFIIDHIGEPYNAYEAGEVLELRPVSSELEDMAGRLLTVELCVREIERKLGLRRKGSEPPVALAPTPVTTPDEPRRRWRRSKDEEPSRGVVW